MEAAERRNNLIRKEAEGFDNETEKESFLLG